MRRACWVQVAAPHRVAGGQYVSAQPGQSGRHLRLQTQFPSHVQSADSAALVYVAALLWGLGWGGVPTLLQTAAGDAGGDHADAAQAMLVTLWNGAMAAGGIVGGILLEAIGTESFLWSMLLLLLPVLVVVGFARRHGFPAKRPHD